MRRSLTSPASSSSSAPATVDAAVNSANNVVRLALEDALTDNPVIFVKLTLTDPTGKQLSQNFYWLAAHDWDYRKLNDMPAVTLQASAVSEIVGNEQHMTVTLTNPSQTSALTTKLTLLDGHDGPRILPAYYSDNYISFLPNEERTIEITYPSSPETTPMLSSPFEAGTLLPPPLSRDSELSKP